MKYVSLGLVLATVLAVESLPAADFKLEVWQQHQEQNTADVPHSAWEQLLQRYVVPAPNGTNQGVNLVRYGDFRPADRAVLDDYIGQLKQVRITEYGKQAQLAYWINLYNALTWQVILDHYPLSSIRKIRISPGLFSVGPWGKKLVRVQEQELSLDDIEHQIVRPIWRDDRVHYALNCASIGCPNIERTAYTRENLQRLLDAARVNYINHPRGVQLQPNGSLLVSSLFKWYSEDFAPDKAGLLAYWKRYADAPLQRALAEFGTKGRITYAYDWSLNASR